MRGGITRGGRWLGVALVLLWAGLVVLVGGLLAGPVTQTDAQEAASWEALGPPGKELTRLYTPASGALLASGQDGLFRSDDGGVSWRTIAPPADTGVVAVSPADHQLLYAAGKAGVFRSEDGGDTWQPVRTGGDEWIALEISPADPSVLYGVAILRPPVDYGSNRDLEFRVSHDAGATWEAVRTQHEHVLPGQQPCSYAFRSIQPDTASTERVLTVEGCTGRGESPSAWMSTDEGHTATHSPDLGGYFPWGANALVGGTGASPKRWYVSLFPPGIPNGNRRQSRIMRTDDDGASWTTVYDADEWPSTTVPRKAIDFSRALTYNPQQPDDVYAVFEHYEPDPTSSSAPSKATGITVRVSHDAGGTWADLGGADLPLPASLAVGIDGRYLFVATGQGVYRTALGQ
jgi:hypothetical protein